MFLRKFIILSKQSEQNSKGHAKLEVRGRRGKISISVENLKTEIGENDIYKAYLVSNKGSEIEEVDIGVVDISKSGRGKLDWEFDPEVIGNKNRDIEKFNIVVIRLDGLEDGKTEVTLAGYIHNDDNTIKEILQQSSTQATKANTEKETEIVEEVEVVEEEEIEEEEIVKEIKENKESKEVNEDNVPKYENMHEKYEELIEEVDEILEKEQSQETSNILKHFAEFDEGVRQEHLVSDEAEIDNHECDKTYKYEEDNPLDILAYFDNVEPLKDKLEGHMWWQLEYDRDNINKEFLPYFHYLTNGYYPFEYITEYTTCQSQIKKYKHHLFGTIEKDQQIRYYLYGIPGAFKKREQPFGGKTGFVTWHKSSEQGDLGYWLLYIDAITGNIVKPI